MKRTKIVNVAAGKKLATVLDAAKAFGVLTVHQKAAVIKNIRQTVDTGKSMKGVPLNDKEKAQAQQLLAWATMNIMVGNVLCPPDSVEKY
jgi:hypothetical protein